MSSRTATWCLRTRAARPDSRPRFDERDGDGAVPVERQQLPLAWTASFAGSKSFLVSPARCCRTDAAAVGEVELLAVRRPARYPADLDAENATQDDHARVREQLAATARFGQSARVTTSTGPTVAAASECFGGLTDAAAWYCAPAWTPLNVADSLRRAPERHRADRLGAGGPDSRKLTWAPMPPAARTGSLPNARLTVVVVEPPNSVVAGCDAVSVRASATGGRHLYAQLLDPGEPTVPARPIP